ncbi:hypothetical protein HPHPP16_1370 [Helicobacter pylori Hp P-16]|nr:hypothetical protein HPHPP16_1370 [Helicobacter pylori Hp P-16]
MSVSIIDRSFCSRIACVFSLSLLKLFSVSFVCFMFLFSFRIQTPLFRRSFGLKMR